MSRLIEEKPILTGKTNVVTGFAFLALFMPYGFVFLFLRDFAPGKEQWISDSEEMTSKMS